MAGASNSKPPEETTRKKGRPRRSKDGASNRRLILDAALSEFARHGYEGTKISDIAKRASVVTPAVHYHFKTKEELWKAAMELSFSELRDQQIVDTDQELKDLDDLSVLRVLARRYIRFAFSRPEHARIVYIESLRDTDRTAWLKEKFLTPIHQENRAVFGRLREKGIIKPYPQMTFFSIMAGAVMAIVANTETVGDLYGLDVGSEQLRTDQENEIFDILFTGILRKSV